MRRCRNQPALHPSLLCALLVLLALEGRAQELLIPAGHYDLAVNYTTEEGWEPYIHDYDGDGQLDPFTTVYSIGASALAQVPNDTDYALLGSPGETVWVVPQIYDPEIVYLGIGAPLLGRNIFSGGLSNRGQITMRMLSVAGSGPEAGGTLSMWQSGFPPSFSFSTADGIGPEDVLDKITANFHAHYNWAFTQPGLYRVTFEFSGTLLPELGGDFTSTQVTYSFEVEHAGTDSPLRYAWDVGGGWSLSSWMGEVFDAFYPWVWSSRHRWASFAPGTPENVWFWSASDGWHWTHQTVYPWLWNVTDAQWVPADDTVF